MVIRKRFELFGTVQGVGFRPFVYRLANDLELFGEVYNDGLGVIIEVQGDAKAIELFAQRLNDEKPALSHIDKTAVHEIAPKDERSFTIGATTNAKRIVTHIPPDTALCDHCKTELFDPSNRRFRHPFISCTNCGPRYTIIERMPYDRTQTSMRHFPMCDQCANEYHNPLDRRFHAQPIACLECGPALLLTDGAANILASGDEALNMAVGALSAGMIVAIKALGGFQLCCDAANETAVITLRARKHRPSKPLAVLFGSIESIEEQAELSKREKELLSHGGTPIVLVKKRSTYNLAEGVAPNIDRLGAMLPSSPIQYLVLDALKKPIVATSANISDEPVIIDDDALFKKLGGIFDMALTHNRDIVNACDDSVMQLCGDRSMAIRRARGFAPSAFALHRAVVSDTLALGAEQKSVIAIGFDKNAVLSPHIGDLKTVDSLEFFERTIAVFKRLYKFEPKRIVCDRHPRYASVVWGRKQNLPIVSVQHHHAHALAVMAEYALDGKALAVAWDGTGYGSDGTIWGGEFLIADYGGFERVAHIKPFGLIGGESAITDPKRIALALLSAAKVDHPLLNENAALVAMLEQKINTPLTSSVGRLFDAVAYLGKIESDYQYEGESGLRIEALFDADEKGVYPFEIVGGVIDTAPMMRSLINDTPNVCASRFINTLAAIALEVCAPYDLPIALCGGVFQNRTLANMLTTKLRAIGKRVYLPSIFPPNDGAIALGQLMYKEE
ncbi:MAG: carbamoyltransferase HypF [Helicobacteraceae bacterium]|jgi:hydrogenase maturation protein HypF|nr:carbamoyltransferase HypF [Helicobacteraceae bacterium]